MEPVNQFQFILLKMYIAYCYPLVTVISYDLCQSDHIKTLKYHFDDLSN
jgi:hypothetical protein